MLAKSVAASRQRESNFWTALFARKPDAAVGSNREIDLRASTAVRWAALRWPARWRRRSVVGMDPASPSHAREEAAARRHAGLLVNEIDHLILRQRCVANGQSMQSAATPVVTECKPVRIPINSLATCHTADGRGDGEAAACARLPVVLRKP